MPRAGPAEARRRAVRRVAAAAALERARELCEGAELLLCVGSSLEVHPVAGLPSLTREAGGAIAILTQGPTPLDDIADVRLRGDAVAELQGLLDTLQGRRQSAAEAPWETIPPIA